MVNVLLTCAGRRNYLLHPFREALAGRGLVLAADASPQASALQEADGAFVVPAVEDPGYLEAILGICRLHRVRLLVCLNDLELPIMARHRERFLEVGTLPVLASADVVDLCFDKWATWQFLRRLGLGVPQVWLTPEQCKVALDRGEASFPLVVKPRWGSGSVGIVFPESYEELVSVWRHGTRRLAPSPFAPDALERDRLLLIQERLRGAEFGLDVVNDLSGRYVATFVKRKLVMRAGETDRAVTMAHSGLEAIGRLLGETLQHLGNLDCDVFVDGAECKVLELNPRFGGGYPFSHAAGANLPAALIAWATGETPRPDWLKVRPHVTSTKCDRIVPVATIPPTLSFDAVDVALPTYAPPRLAEPAGSAS